MLTIEVAPDTTVNLDCPADGVLPLGQFKELLETALMSQEVVDFVQNLPKMKRIPMPPPNIGRPPLHYGHQRVN